MAPELLRHESCNTLQSDVFSFGILLYEVFARRDPYEGEKAGDVLRLVADKSVRKRPVPPRHMPDPVKALMKDCIEDEAELRPSFEEIDTRLKRIDADSLDTGKNTKTSSVSVRLCPNLYSSKSHSVHFFGSNSLYRVFLVIRYFPTSHR